MMTDLPSSTQIVSSEGTVTSVRRVVDQDGNVVSEDVQTSTLPDTEVITTGMSSNVQLVSSEGKVTRRVLDEEGNVISEETEAMSVDGNRDFEDVTQTGVPSNVQGVSSQSSVISVRRTLDEFGNVVSEDTETNILTGEKDANGFVTLTTETVELAEPRLMICTPICTESDFSPGDDASTVKITPSDLEGKKGKTVENQAS